MITPSQNSPPRNKQRGAAMIIMMLIVMLGLIALFTYRMDRKGPELDADRKTALALAQAKEALLGRAASNSDAGSLPCANTDNTGVANTIPIGGGKVTCVTRFGWFPWKTIGIGNIVDGSASYLWYMLASGYIDKGTYSPPPYATPLTVTVITVTVDPVSLSEAVVNTATLTNIAAVIIAPGVPLSGQDRSGMAANNYLYSSAYFEGSATPATDAITLKVEQNNHPPLKYNDRYLLVTNLEILDRSTPSVTKALAATLSSYATYPSSPWLPSGGVWSTTYSGWGSPDPTTGIYPINYQYISNTSATVQFELCAPTYAFGITRTSSGDQIDRRGHC